jgi:tRNA A-37 threonylcarbamoyl transferase component Bud32
VAREVYTGKTLEGRYAVERLLGEGGMGAVYQGLHVMVGRKVAIKFLHSELTGSEEVVKRFYREARAAAAIGHRNIVEVLDVGLSELGEPYLVMEFLEGESLGEMLERVGPIELGAALGVLDPALRALSAAHAKGIVHRDLKPDNIFLGHGPDGEVEVKLIDFGISKFADAEGKSQLTQTGSLLGTPAYMAPEQARGDRELDARADIYAMGVILYQALTGELPFDGEHYNQLLISVLTEQPRDPSEAYAGFPSEARELVLSTLSKDPAERPQSAAEMLERLKALEGWGGRSEHLTRVASSIEKRNVAAGDVGDALREGSGSSASAVYSQMMREGTPGVWAGTRPKGARRRKGLLIGLSVAAAALVAAVVLAWVFTGGDEEEAVGVPLAAPEPEPEPAAEPAEADDPGAVRIEVRGVPQGAKIYYDGAPVPVNPFPVERRERLVKLEVRAEGYEPFVTAVIPGEDLEIEAELRESPREEEDEAEAEPSGRGKRRAEAAGKKPEKKSEPAEKKDPEKKSEPAEKKPGKKPGKKPEGMFKKGKRGTKFGNEFE